MHMKIVMELNHMINTEAGARSDSEIGLDFVHVGEAFLFLERSRCRQGWLTPSAAP